MACVAAGLVGLTAPAAAAPDAIVAPANQAARSAVGLTFDSTGSGMAVYRGADNAVYMRTFFNAGTWSAQSGIGGAIIGAPAIAVGRTTVVVAARGTDNALWVRMMNQGLWGSWTSWGGRLTSSPALTGGSDPRVDAFVRGADNALWTRTIDGSQTAWRSLGGRLSTAPAAVTIQDHSFDVAVAGSDHAIWNLEGSRWHSMGGRTYSAPAIGYIPQTNGGFYLARGVDNALWADGVGGGDSTGWQKLGGRLSEGPTAAGTQEPEAYMIVAVRGVDEAVWTTVYGAGRPWGHFTRAWIPDETG
jgi:hypothetical protein